MTSNYDENPSEKVMKAMELGFSKELCIQAFQALGGEDNTSVENAIEFIVSKMTNDSQNTSSNEADTAPSKVDAAALREADKGGDGNNTSNKTPKSYRCTDTGKLFRTLADAQAYAEHTGYTNFEESDIEVAPLSEEEKKMKLLELRSKVASKRLERESELKLEERNQEIERRKRGKDIGVLREEREALLRQAEYARVRKEKEDAKRHREALRIGIANDKGEQASDAARRRGETPEQIRKAFEDAYAKAMGSVVEKETNVSSSEAIEALLRYKACDTGLLALKTAQKMLNNIIQTPDEEKFKLINLQNPAFKRKIASLNGGIALFKSAGFTHDKSQDKLLLKAEDLSIDKIRQVVELIEKALQKGN